MGLPRRIDVVFRFWPCDKKNHGWREGPPLTVPCQSFDLLPGLRPPVKSVSNETRILLYVAGREPQHNFGRFKTTMRELSVNTTALMTICFPLCFQNSYRKLKRT